MKLFVWVDPWDVSYGSTLAFAVAETVEDAKAQLRTSPSYAYGYLPGPECQHHSLGEPSRVIDLPCAEWHMWSE